MKSYFEESGITIYHADCREMLSEIQGAAIVTDPPYGLGEIMESPGLGKGHRKWAKHWSSGAPAWDKEAPAIVSSLPSLASTCIIWGGNFFDLPPARGWLVWDKVVRNFTSSHCELAWTNVEQPVRAFNYANPWLHAEGKHHPTQKPLPLMKWCLSFVADDLVVDPFMGSGTTLVAAKSMGKQAIGIEIEEAYCEIAVQRLAQGVLEFG